MVELHSGREVTEHMQEAAKNLPLVLVALFPIVDPLGGSPYSLALTREYAWEARKALSWRIAMNKFFLAGWVVFCWRRCACLFRDFAASGSNRRRPDRDGDRMGAAEAARRRKTRRAQNRPDAGHIPPGILSLDHATDRRPWINLRGHHAGSERGSPSLLPSFEYLGCTHWINLDRDQYFALLWICRPVGAHPGSNRDDGDHAIIVLFPGLYWCADCLERD